MTKVYCDIKLPQHNEHFVRKEEKLLKWVQLPGSVEFHSTKTCNAPAP
jgi:hypothetical protein